MALTIMMDGKQLYDLKTDGHCVLCMRKSHVRLVDPGTTLSIPDVLHHEKGLDHIPVMIDKIEDAPKKGRVLVYIKKFGEEKDK